MLSPLPLSTSFHPSFPLVTTILLPIQPALYYHIAADSNCLQRGLRGHSHKHVVLLLALYIPKMNVGLQRSFSSTVFIPNTPISNISCQSKFGSLNKGKEKNFMSLLFLTSVYGSWKGRS